MTRGKINRTAVDSRKEISVAPVGSAITYSPNVLNRAENVSVIPRTSAIIQSGTMKKKGIRCAFCGLQPRYHKITVDISTYHSLTGLMHFGLASSSLIYEIA